MEKEMIKLQNVQLPFFFGFYDSPFLNGELIDEAIEGEIEYYRNALGEEYEYDDFEFKTQDYKDVIVKAFTNAFHDYLPSWIKRIENPILDSPDYYNFRTDEIYVTAVLVKDWKEQLQKFVETNCEWLKERIRKDWSSRDGFTSFISTDLEEFMDSVYALDYRYISILMQYDIELKNGFDDMYWYLTENTFENFHQFFSIGDFVRNNKEKEKENNANGTENTTNNIR